MISQTFAMFVDAYRELNSKMMFWLCMVITVLIVGVFAILGIKAGPTGPVLTLLWWELPFPAIAANASDMYKYIFVVYGIDVWLTSAGLFLALISTAGLIPELMSNGSVELYLSRPISRTRLLLTKYAAGLAFVTLQVGVFAVASFLVIGLRGGEWMPKLLLAIPIVVLLFSYLWSISALAAVLTRSTIGAVTITMAFWVIIPIVTFAERALVSTYHGVRIAAQQAPPFIEAAKLSMMAQQIKANTETDPTKRDRAVAAVETNRRSLSQITESLAKAQKSLPTLEFWVGIAGTAKSILPKTAETGALVKDTLFTPEQVTEIMRRRRGREDDEPGRIDGLPAPSPKEFDAAMASYFDGRTSWWVIGTSLAFQAGMLSIACWRFSRRDF